VYIYNLRHRAVAAAAALFALPANWEMNKANNFSSLSLTILTVAAT
jgi:hypothetical protein